MQISTSLIHRFDPAMGVKAASAVGAAASPASREATRSPGAAQPLFSGGLANWNAMMTPETLGALFALNQDGGVQFGANGSPVIKAGVSITAPKDVLVQQHLRAQHAQATGAETGYTPSISDAQKQFFHAVTGYNLAVEGPLWGVRDDQGDLVPNAGPKGGRASPAWQLASDIVSNGLEPEGAQQTIDADWFAQWSQRMSDAGMTLPAGWADKAKRYFDDALNAMFEKDKTQAADKADA